MPRMQLILAAFWATEQRSDLNGHAHYCFADSKHYTNTQWHTHAHCQCLGQQLLRRILSPIHSWSEPRLHCAEKKRYQTTFAIQTNTWHQGSGLHKPIVYPIVWLILAFSWGNELGQSQDTVVLHFLNTWLLLTEKSQRLLYLVCRKQP